MIARVGDKLPQSGTGYGSVRERGKGNPLKVVAFLERYLQPDQTFIFRQMSGLPSCAVRYVARYRVPQHPYSEEKVHYFGSARADKQGVIAWRLFRLQQIATRRYTWLTRNESRRLARLVMEFGPDVVHAHWAPDAMLVAPLCREHRIPLLVHFHGYDASRLMRDRIYVANVRKLLRERAVAVTVAESMRQRLLSLGVGKDRIHCHYTGVPEEYFVPGVRCAPEPGRFVLLQVGRLAETKGHRYAVAAMAAARRSVDGLRLRIVGDGELERDIRIQIDALGMTRSIEIVGRLSPTAIIKEMRQADALMLPSCTASDGCMEGLPNVAVEAMAAGLPVIGTRHSGIPEALRYRERGWLAPEADPEALADRIQRLASDQDLWTRLSEEGRQIARTDFHLPTQNAKLEALYASLVSSVRTTPT